jgi:hypothetical protein
MINVGFVLLAAVTLAADRPEATTQAICRKVEKAPVLDGRLDDACWAEATVIDKFPAYWSNTPSGIGTKARLVWDDDALYFSATMTDKEMRSFGKKRNDYLWNGDVFEMFWKPHADKPAYYETQVNPLGVILDIPFPKRGYSFDELAAKPHSGMTAVAIVDGTLDKPGDVDKGWTIEGKIPWSFFAPTGGRPNVGDTWLFALCRYDYGPDGTKPVLTSSAPLTVGSFHRYEDYGRLTFEGKK